MPKELATILKELQGGHSLKAWSVIITFFGDSVAPRGGAISTTTMQTVMATMGIGAGAVRTAFSRLAKDGWVTRQKVGRNTYYRLSETGQAPFSEAEAVIYAGPSNMARSNSVDWVLVTCGPHQNNNDELYRNGIKINKDSYLFSDLSSRQKKALSDDRALISTVKSQALPQWVLDRVAPASVANSYMRLQEKADEISTDPPCDPLSALAVRTLLIHEWRRLLLRRDETNSSLLPEDWPYEDCRKSVSNLYQQISPAAEHWLDTQASGPDGSLMQSGVDTLQRFG